MEIYQTDVCANYTTSDACSSLGNFNENHFVEAPTPTNPSIILHHSCVWRDLGDLHLTYRDAADHDVKLLLIGRLPWGHPLNRLKKRLKWANADS